MAVEPIVEPSDIRAAAAYLSLPFIGQLIGLTMIPAMRKYSGGDETLVGIVEQFAAIAKRAATKPHEPSTDDVHIELEAQTRRLRDELKSLKSKGATEAVRKGAASLLSGASYCWILLAAKFCDTSEFVLNGEDVVNAPKGT